MHKAVILATAAHALQAPQLNGAARRRRFSMSAGAVWVGSILGGAAGTPFVVKATNSWYSDPTVLELRPGRRRTKSSCRSGRFYGLIGLRIRPRSIKAARAGRGHYIANLAGRRCSWAQEAQVAALQFGLPGSRGRLVGLQEGRPLLIPYAAWLYATVLNLAICRLNLASAPNPPRTGRRRAWRRLRKSRPRHAALPLLPAAALALFFLPSTSSCRGGSR